MARSIRRSGSSALWTHRPGARATPGDNFSINVQLEDEAQAAKIFAALSDGGTVSMPFEPMFFAKKFGMLKDRFGIAWMVHVPVAVPA